MSYRQSFGSLHRAKICPIGNLSIVNTELCYGFMFMSQEVWKSICEMHTKILVSILILTFKPMDFYVQIRLLSRFDLV